MQSQMGHRRPNRIKQVQLSRALPRRSTLTLLFLTWLLCSKGTAARRRGRELGREAPLRRPRRGRGEGR